MTNDPADPVPDVSIILNIHREAGYLARTMDSLDAAAAYAGQAGFTCEMIIVADRPDAETLDWLAARDLSAYATARTVVVDNGSLGLSRNDGIAVARGTYILTADADDLVSFNTIAAGIETARTHGGPALFFPQYYQAFGMDPHLYELHPLSEVTPQALVGGHPYVSRFFARRADLGDLRFHDLRLSSGFAYEDWHFNMKAVAAGLDLRIVPQTAVYYRQRAASLLRQADAMSMRTTAHSDFFTAQTYLRATGPHVQAARRKPRADLCEAGAIRRRYLSHALLVEMMLAAARIDPGVDPCRIHHVHAFSNAGLNRLPGIVWREICLLLGQGAFDEIVLVPFLSPGGGEKYVLSVVTSLLEQAGDRRLLIVSGQAPHAHAGLENLPKGAVFLDLCADHPDLDDAAREMLTLRIIQTFGPSARLHIKTCPYAQRFLRRFGASLDNDIVYYRFCDTYLPQFGEWVPLGDEFDFLSDCGAQFRHIICDNDAIRSRDCARLDRLAGRYVTLHNHAGDAPVRLSGGVDARHRILWASRLDAQKRPELLAQIAELALTDLPQVQFEMWGAAVLDRVDMGRFTRLKNLTYRGPFNGFAALPLDRYGLFVYTSSFDGLPNILLEAMQAGLVCIGPGLGGIPEVLDAATGFVVDPNLPDEEMARAYLAAIADCLADPAGMERRGAAARRKIATAHSRESFDTAVAQIFGEGEDDRKGDRNG